MSNGNIRALKKVGANRQEKQVVEKKPVKRVKKPVKKPVKKAAAKDK